MIPESSRVESSQSSRVFLILLSRVPGYPVLMSNYSYSGLTPIGYWMIRGARRWQKADSKTPTYLHVAQHAQQQHSSKLRGLLSVFGCAAVSSTAFLTTQRQHSLSSAAFLTTHKYSLHLCPFTTSTVTCIPRTRGDGSSSLGPVNEWFAGRKRLRG